MKLSRTVSYAVRATLQLAKSDSGAPIPCSKLAAEGDMPERFLLQILRTLVTNGILRSTRGVDGGYSLVKPANQVSLLEIIEAIDGRLDGNDQTSDDDSMQSNLQMALLEVTATARRQLEAIKLSQLLQPPQDHLNAENSSEEVPSSESATSDSTPEPTEVLATAATLAQLV